MDAQNIQLELDEANKKLQEASKEIGDLKYKLKNADELLTSHIAAFVGADFENEIAKINDAIQADSKGDRATLNTEIKVWNKALEILLKGTAAPPKNRPEEKIHGSERKSIEQIIAVLADMAGLNISAHFAADTPLRAHAACKGLILPQKPDTVAKHLKAAFERAKSDREDSSS